jgi:hypothetical protein
MCRFSRCLQWGRRLNSRLSSAEVCASCRLWRIGSSRIRRNRCRSAGHQNQCAMPAGSRSTNVSAGVGGLAVLCLFPGGEQRDLADLWPADAIVSEMTATGFTDVEAERRHVHRERDLAELWSAVGSASGTHNCCHHRTLGIRAGGLRRIDRDLGDPHTPRARADHLCSSRWAEHCKIAPIGEQHSPRRGCSARRRFASPRGSRCFSGRGFLR